MGEASAGAGLDRAYREHRGFLWSLCYRMTSSATDAEDLVQETFARAVERPPADTSRPWRPWLVRVALNLARDHLRRRKSAAYVGPWLPMPVETDDLVERAYEPAGTEARYELLESVSYAFLIALEALQPNQRAVLLLRDVFEYSGRETAEVLDLSEANVRQVLHRARQAMAVYDRARVRPSESLREQTADLITRFMLALASRDRAGMEALLAEDVVVLNDGAGRYFAARVPVVGRERVARFHLKIVRDDEPRVDLRVLNGLPAVIGTFPAAGPGYAPRFATLGWPDREGRIAHLSTVVAPAKLEAIRWPG